ncbi:anti-sigma factor [Oceanobacillus manasiensis]|uniref:anti-sigma factor n=1 Tax=Oceanobacillus manasiensis TaxID=586413 RepID=UPI0005AA9591|nr:anti-sigma factor [Oceanobacillus manasiensis]
MAKQCDRLIDYFNNQLTEREREAFEIHLGECASCQEELAELEELTMDLPFGVDAVEPPEDMKDRVLSNVKNVNQVKDNAQSSDTTTKVTDIKDKKDMPPLKKKKSWYKPLIVATLTLSLVGNGVALIYLNQEEKPESTAPSEPEQEEVSLDTLSQKHALQPSEGVSAQATALMIEQNNHVNLVVQAEDLPPLSGEEAYQVWVLEDGTPYRAGTFISSEDGTGAVSYVMDYDKEYNFDTIAITKEPNANSQQPQGDILLSSPL